MPLQLPHPTAALHVYRHLLREASYLPPVIVPYVTNRISTKFRRHRQDLHPRPLRQANFHLRRLRAATAGDRGVLEGFVSAAFGRLGPRRRELLTKFLVPEPPADSDALEAVIAQRQNETKLDREQHPRQEAATVESSASASESPHSKGRTRERKADWLDKWDTTKLLALLKSQSQAPNIPPNSSISAGRLKIYNAVPKLNTLGRPFPAKPARTKTRKWWAFLANRTLPPLSKSEWDVLAGLATDGASTEGLSMPPRRPVAVSLPSVNDNADANANAAAASRGSGKEAETTTKDPDHIRLLRAQAWDMEGYLTKPARWVDRKSKRGNVTRSGIEQPNDEFGHATNMTGRERSVKPRTMRRLYARAWSATPVMVPKPGRSGGGGDAKGGRSWDIKWGEPAVRVSEATDAHAVLFEGVDRKGKLLEEARRPR